MLSFLPIVYTSITLESEVIGITTVVIVVCIGGCLGIVGCLFTRTGIIIHQILSGKEHHV